MYPKMFERTLAQSPRSEEIERERTAQGSAGTRPWFAGPILDLATGQTAGIHRGHRRTAHGQHPPLPCLLAAFSSGDAVVGCFDDEAQTAMETTPQPNLIIPLKLSDPTSVRQGFQALGVVCDTLAAGSRLIDLMPGNDDGVIDCEDQR